MDPSQVTALRAIALLVLLALLCFGFLIPESRERRRKKAMRDSLKPGDAVFTSAGLRGVVTEVNGDLVLLEVGRARTEIEVAKWAIMSLDERKRDSRNSAV